MIDINIPERLEAISELAKKAGAKFTISNDEITRWTKGTKPTEEETLTFFLPISPLLSIGKSFITTPILVD